MALELISVRADIVAGARASINKACQGSPPERQLIEITQALYGSQH